jgi:hypothetical protein
MWIQVSVAVLWRVAALLHLKAITLTFARDFI